MYHQIIMNSTNIEKSTRYQFHGFILTTKKPNLISSLSDR